MNMGGGLGVKYIDTDQPPSISSLAEAVTSAMNKYSVNIPTIYIEPGRSIISTAEYIVQGAEVLKRSQTVENMSLSMVVWQITRVQVCIRLSILLKSK